VAHEVRCPGCGNVLRIYVEEDLRVAAYTCPRCLATFANPAASIRLEPETAPTTTTAVTAARPALAERPRYPDEDAAADVKKSGWGLLGLLLLLAAGIGSAAFAGTEDDRLQASCFCFLLFFAAVVAALARYLALGSTPTLGTILYAFLLTLGLLVALFVVFFLVCIATWKPRFG
jgi:hypothetical protein